METHTTDQASEGTARPTLDQLRDDALRALYTLMADKANNGDHYGVAEVGSAIQAVFNS